MTKYPKTYIVGGAIRNILLKRSVGDVDIATSATPEQVIKCLKEKGILFSSAHKNFGIIVAISKTGKKVEIATFRKEVYGKSRFPKVTFVPNHKKDSVRRDFTINALYYSVKDNEVTDFHDGLKDILDKRIRFIGNIKNKITEDPLRIVRAYRFALEYNLKIDTKLENILSKHKNLLQKINPDRVQREINCVASQKIRKQLQKVIHSNS